MGIIRIYVVTPGRDLMPCTERYIENVKAWLEEADVGDTVQIDIREIEESEYEDLPEYIGP